MSWLLRCECGTEMAARNEDDLVLAAESHIADGHPALAAPPERADLLAMAEEIQDEV